MTLLLKQWINPAWVLTSAGSRYLQLKEPAAMFAKPFDLALKPCSPETYSTEALLAEIMRCVLRGIG